MRKSRFTDEQIAFAMRQEESGTSRLKSLVAALILDKQILQDVL